MKKILLMMALALTVGTSFAFTGEEAVSKKVLTSFKSDFAGVTDAAWTTAQNYYKVAFTMNDQKLFAFYNVDGEFMAVTRYISSFQLPIKLQASLKKSYGKYWVSDLFELSTNDGTGYYITLETADSKIVLRSLDGDDWSTYEKDRKA